MEFVHESVMLSECIAGLNINPGGVYVDATLGGGGHSLEIAKRLKGGRLIGIDKDREAIAAAKKRLAGFEDKTVFVNDSFENLGGILNRLGIDKIDGILFDLGVSSYQLDAAHRGFSYNKDGRLDMRMSQDASFDAYQLVNTYDRDKLRQILYQYGGEKNAPAIANAICRYREKKPIETTLELADIIKSTFSPSERYGHKHAAKRSFQAIRIEVNGELKILSGTLTTAVERLRPGGRIAVISFHSLEDKIVKDTLGILAKGCICDKSKPCVCGRVPQIKAVTRKPVVASAVEAEHNRRAHSAKLRIYEKL